MPSETRRLSAQVKCSPPTVFAACAACFSLRAMFRVCHDLLSVFGFGFNFLCDSRVCGAVVDAIYALFSLICQAAPASHLQRLRMGEP
jgi:hypothetical protein